MILLPEVDEKSVVQTRFATSTLALLRASLGEDLSAAIADARAVLAEDEAQCLAGVADAEQVTFLGRGWTIGLAAEAALKLRESAQFWTESYPAMEYRHGPVSIATAGRVTWALGNSAAGSGGAGARHRCALRDTGTSTRSPSSCGCTGSASRRPGRATSTPTTRVTSPARWSCRRPRSSE